MASISSLMGSSSSGSIYGSRTNNMITGLASGLDTESMIEGMVQGYQQKILQLQQSKTKLQWQQEAYQSISNKLVEFSRKYASYGYSTTNLMSSSFFNNAVITSTAGKYADMVTASGKSDSTITINAVAQLATAARATSSASTLSGVSASGGQITTTAKEDLNLDGDINVSTLQGSMTLTYGTKEVTIEFGELEFLDKNGNGTGTVTAEQLKDAIVKKLGEQTITTSSGSTSADDLIKVEVADDGTISFSDAKSNNSVYISDATGKLADTLQLDQVVQDKGSSFKTTEQTYSESIDRAEYLSDKSISVTLDGVTKTISLADVLKTTESGGVNTSETDFVSNLNTALDKAFGAGKVVASTASGKLSFTVKDGSTLGVQSDVDAAMGFDGGLTSYLDTGKTLKELASSVAFSGDKNENMTLTFGSGNNSIQIMGTAVKSQSEPYTEQADGTFQDADGALVDKDGYYVNSDGERIYEYTLNVNGKELTFNQDSSMDKVLNSINASETGVSVSYSKLTNQFVFTADETGEAGQIELSGSLADVLKGSWSKQDGQDAVFQATINGETKNFTRSSNTFDMDGMSVTLNGVFNNQATTDPIKSSDVTSTGDGSWFVDGEDVTFSSKTDTDTVLEAIKSMVTDFNAMVTEIKKAYTDQPLKQSDGSKYDPLTADDEADMTESEIKAYEEKAKTGILFMDSDLSNLYSALRSAITGSADSGYLQSIGIETSYEDGLTTITLDESKLKTALETDLDGVRDVFTKSKKNGAESDGLMASIETITDRYAATTGATKGILIEKAGSQYSPAAALDNTILDKMEEIDEQIASWQSKMSDKVDYYTNKFTQLELLINQMNSQSSALAGLTGGY